MPNQISEELHQQCYRVSQELGGFLAALELAFAAGRDSAGRLIEADTETRFESQIWWSDGDTEEFSHFGPDPDMLRERVVGSARDEIGEGNDVATVARSEARSFDVRTYRVNEQVLARFGDWVRVPEAGGTDVEV